MRSVLLGPLAALFLVGCSGTFGQRAVTTEQPQPAVETEHPGAPAQPESPKLAEQLTRIAGELSDLQNTVAKLMVSSRQVEDQLTHLQRRLSELEAQNRGRPPVVPGGFAAPAPTQAPVTTATTAPAEDLYRVGTEKLRAKDLDAALLIFYDLIAAYPDHPLRERAQFLAADTLYGRTHC